MRTTAFLLGCFLFVGVTTTQAQTFPGFGSATVISLSPTYARAHETVTAQLTTTTPNELAGSYVRWTLNEKIIREGVDATSASFDSGALGGIQHLSANVILSSGVQVSAETQVRPVEVSLSWEAATYAPPLYQGRTLYTTGARIRAEARTLFLDEAGKRIDPGALVYSWKRNGSALADYSGRGRSSITIEGPKFYGTDVLSVTVSTLDHALEGEAAVRIETTEPILVTYILDPLLGLLSNAALSNDTPIQETTIAAAPYFMAATTRNSALLTYEWRVNGSAVSGTSTDAGVLSLSRDSNITSAVISLSVTHKNLLLQEAAGKWNLRFGSGDATTNNNPFFR